MVKQRCQKLTSLNVLTIKKVVVLLNFCLIGKIRHNFLVPRIIESACKTFMPIPTLDIDRVRATTG